MDIVVVKVWADALEAAISQWVFLYCASTFLGKPGAIFKGGPVVFA